MKSKIMRTKIAMYVALILLTVFFSRLSFAFCEDNLEDRLRPQIVRAIVQISEILPQLEKSEQAVRSIYNNLERNRQRVYTDREGVETPAERDAEYAETIVGSTLSWMNRVTKLRVGRSGYVIVVSQKDYSILAHPKEEFIGQTLYMSGGWDAGIADIADLEELRNKHTEKDIPGRFHIFFPESVFDLKIDQLVNASYAGIIGSAFAYKDTYILCGVTIWEGIIQVVVRCFFSTLIFFVVIWVIIRYIGFSLAWHRDGRLAFGRKLIICCALGTVILFLFTWYYQTIMDITSDLTAVNSYAKMGVDTLNTYNEYRKELSEWLDQQYLEECQLAAKMIKNRGIDNITRQDMAWYAEELGVDYIYVFDKNGKVVVTNSPYDHFIVSKNKEDQSYAFNSLLEGRKYVIQGVQEDEASGEEMQYIGVSLRDSDDLADGFVQIAVRPDFREQLLNPINVMMVLDDIVIGLPDYALAIDKESMKVVADTGLGVENTGIEYLGFDEADIKDGFNEKCFVGGETYYSGVGEAEEVYLMPLVRSTDNSNALIIALKTALLCVVAYLIIAFMGLFGYGKVLIAAESEESDEDEGSAEETAEENRGIFSILKDFIKTGDKPDSDFEKRWRNQRAVPVEKRTPEMRTSGIIYSVLLVFSYALIFYEVFMLSMGMNDEDLIGFSYVLLGKWERGVNLFSFSFCLFLLCVLYVFRVLVNQVLYSIARISDLKHETVLLLLRNALRYACAIVFLYIGLAKFGIDTRALWASAGVLSLMVGFGAKDLVSDIIAGLFIIFDGTLKVGDYVTGGGWSGTVQKIGIRSTRIENFSDTKIFNNSSLKDIVNSYGEEAREILKVSVPKEADLLEIEKLLEKELPRMARQHSEVVNSIRYQGVDSFERGCVVLRFAIFAPSSDRNKALREVRRDIKLLFDREHISIV